MDASAGKQQLKARQSGATDLDADLNDGDLDQGYAALTAEQAQALRAQHPSYGPWWVVLGQLVVGLFVVLLAWVISGKEAVALSAACGVAAVVIPAALFARGLTGRFASVNAGAAVFSFFVWELIKIVTTVGILFAAQRWVVDLSWLAMLLGLIVTIKVYWLALAFKRKARPVQGKTLNGKSN